MREIYIQRYRYYYFLDILEFFNFYSKNDNYFFKKDLMRYIYIYIIKKLQNTIEGKIIIFSFLSLFV